MKKVVFFLSAFASRALSRLWLLTRSEPASYIVDYEAAIRAVLASLPDCRECLIYSSLPELAYARTSSHKSPFEYEISFAQEEEAKKHHTTLTRHSSQGS